MNGDPKPSILVVEDENVVAMDLVSSLEKLQYPVVGVAASGEEAVALAQSSRPGLVLMDIQLRGRMDGIEAAQLIQETLFIPVVYLTAYSDEATLERARVTHPFGYVLKPFEDREVEVAVQVALFRHKLERALRDSERRLDAILESIADAVIATDSDRRITFINRSAERLVGWKSERAQGRSLSDVLKVSPREDGFRTVAREREVIPVEIVESPVLDANGKPSGYVTVARDVSERLRAQKAHERALVEGTARAAAEKEQERARLKSEISLILADMNQPSDMANALRRAAQMLIPNLADWCVLHLEGNDDALHDITVHADPDKLVWVEELHRRWPPDRDAARGTYAVMRTGQSELLEAISDETLAQIARDPEHLEALRKAGITSYICVPLRARARVVGALGLVSIQLNRRYDASDLTFAQQLADRAAIAIDNARLYHEAYEARTVAERLFEAEQKVVRQLERAVRFSEMFVGILGHDLRNPLFAITTAASLVLNRAESDRIATPVRRILTSAGRMSRMIDQILDFTHVRLGRGIPLEPKLTDLGDICRLVLDELKGDAEEGTELTLEFQGDPVGEWDGDRLSQLVSNLAGNAVQHRQRRTPVGVRIDGSARDRVTLVVENEGSIPPEIVPVIFEPFRGGANKREGSSGLGLGLHISEQIVIAHGGSIRVEAAATRARFIVDLPRVPPAKSEKVFTYTAEGTPK